MSFKKDYESPLGDYYELNFRQMLVRKFIDEFLANVSYTERNMNGIKNILISLKEEIDYILKLVDEEKVRINEGMYDFNIDEGDEDDLYGVQF